MPLVIGLETAEKLTCLTLSVRTVAKIQLKKNNEITKSADTDRVSYVYERENMTVQTFSYFENVYNR